MIYILITPVAKEKLMLTQEMYNVLPGYKKSLYKLLTLEIDCT